MNNVKRIKGLDYIRGISCLLVILYHYTTRFVEIYPQYSEKWKFRVSFGYMGVAMFFLLSGYFAVGGVQSRENEKKKFGTYIKKKVKRLYPCYWIGIILTFVVTKIFLVDRSVSAITAIINLSMLQSFVGIESVDGAYWTLANELIFYTFVAVVLIKLKQSKKFYIWAAIWLAIEVILQFYINKNTILYLIMSKLLMPRYAHMFLAGGLIFCIFNEKKYLNWERVIMGIALCMCMIIQFWSFGTDYGIFFLIGSILFIAMIKFEMDGERYPNIVDKILKPISFVAAISYPLYLIHQNIGYAIIVQLYNYGISNEFVIIIPLVIMIVIAYGMHLNVENKIK